MFKLFRGNHQLLDAMSNTLTRIKHAIRGQAKTKKRLNKSLQQLKHVETRLNKTVEKHQKQMQEMSAEIDKIKEQYDWALDEASTTIAKYDKQIIALRDELKINEKTVEAMDASLNRLRQLWKAETAIQVRRELGANEDTK